MRIILVKDQLKKPLILVIKILIGVISFFIIYKRLNEIPHLKEQCLMWFQKPEMYIILMLVLFLMPVNWGIESYKWQSITKLVELVSYPTSLKSIFSGICVGNIAPGRAMEFLAKIMFFKKENRPNITILHFINGMFQMLITVTIGLISITYKLNQNNSSSNFIYFVLAFGVCMILFFCWAILNVNTIQKKIKFIPWFKKFKNATEIKISKTLIIKLLSLSVIRYAVFTSQFYLIYNALNPENNILEIFMSIAAYFMLTSLIPMISVIEPAIRAAIALFVFGNSSDNTVIIVLSSTFIWIINVVVPSGIGYIIILREKLNFREERVN